jgi:hypothetical protein
VGGVVGAGAGVGTGGGVGGAPYVQIPVDWIDWQEPVPHAPSSSPGVQTRAHFLSVPVDDLWLGSKCRKCQTAVSICIDRFNCCTCTGSYSP